MASPSPSAELSWAIPPALTDLLALDASAAAGAIEALLSQTHPNIRPIPPSVPSAPSSLPAPSTPSSSTTTLAPSTASTIPPFLAALKTTTKADALTWNGALGHSSTENPLLDLFDGLQAGARAEKVFEMLSKAWECDPEK